MKYTHAPTLWAVLHARDTALAQWKQATELEASERILFQPGNNAKTKFMNKCRKSYTSYPNVKNKAQTSISLHTTPLLLLSIHKLPYFILLYSEVLQTCYTGSAHRRVTSLASPAHPRPATNAHLPRASAQRSARCGMPDQLFGFFLKTFRALCILNALAPSKGRKKKTTHAKSKIVTVTLLNPAPHRYLQAGHRAPAPARTRPPTSQGSRARRSLPTEGPEGRHQEPAATAASLARSLPAR